MRRSLARSNCLYDELRSSSAERSATWPSACDFFLVVSSLSVNSSIVITSVAYFSLSSAERKSCVMSSAVPGSNNGDHGCVSVTFAYISI